jgi:hypothetical protein
MAGVIPDGQLAIRAAVAQAFPAVPHPLGPLPSLPAAAQPSSEADRHAQKGRKTHVCGGRPLERSVEGRSTPEAAVRRDDWSACPEGPPRRWPPACGGGGSPAPRSPHRHGPEPGAGGNKGAWPQARGRLKTLLRRGLDATASLGPAVRVASGWGPRAAHRLPHDAQCAEAAVQRRRHGRRGAMGQPHANAGSLAPAVGHCRKGRRSDWPGLLHGDSVPALPRTTNDLEQFFGAYRSHERRATGRQVASPAVVLRGAVRLLACAATRLRPFTSAALAPDTVRAWQALRHALETRRHQRPQRRRFRRAPAPYRAKLEADLLQLILPP